MSRGQWAVVLMALGVAILLAQWSSVAKRFTASGEGDRSKHIVIWSNSGSPEMEKKAAERFMARNPDIRVDLHTAASTSFGNIINLSFLTGNPPDLLQVSATQLREYVYKGLLRPLDDLLAAELRRNPGFLDNRIGGELTVVRFRADPDDFYIRERERYPLQAARLINMDGRVIGFSQLGSADKVLTYNKRLFREAGARFPEAGLLDERGEPIPPRTWADLVRVAKVITEYGATFADPAQRPYGVVVQGQRPIDLHRGVGALALTAGSNGFDFVNGRFAYDDPAFLGALKVFCLLEAQGSVLPGTGTRFYEVPRTLLAQGRAAMLIDGPHAAFRGAQAAPIYKLDIGVAPVPVPDEASERLIGFPVGRGTMSRALGGSVGCVSSACRDPEAVWVWNQQNDSLEMQKDMMALAYGQPSTREAVEKIFLSEDPEAVEFRRTKLLPFQFDVYRVSEMAQPWPIAPLASPTQTDDYLRVLASAFATVQADHGVDLDAAIAQARAGLERYTAEINQALAASVARGDENPGRWTLPGFSPLEPRAATMAQMQRRPPGAEQLPAIRASLPASVRDEVHGFRPPWAGLPLAIVLGMIVLTLGGFLAWSMAGAARAGRPALGVFGAMRESWSAYVFIVPAVISLYLFVIYPALFQVWLSLHRGDGVDVSSMVYVGLDQFARILDDTTFTTQVVPRTLLYMVVVAVGEIAISLFLALLLNLPLRGVSAYRTAFFVPMVTSMAALSTVFICLFAGKDSVVNEALAGLGLLGPGAGRDLLDAPYALWTVMSIAIWHGLPYNTILCLAGLQSVDPSLYEAAKVDGAGAWRRFWSITMPQMRPIIVIILFNGLVGAARHFGTVYTMTEGGKGTEIVSTYIFRWGVSAIESQSDVGYASALGLAYALLLALLTSVNVWYMARRWRARLAVAEGRA